MATFKTISDGNIQTTRNVLNQLVDFVAEDVSGSAANNTRKKYQVFVTGGFGGPGVTSSLFHTVYDQSHTLQTSNELFDLTMGIFSGSPTVLTASGGTLVTDTRGKMLFPSESLMMREKISVYSQFAQLLLGDSEAQFTAPFTKASSTGASSYYDDINEALFVPFKRLFTRDGIKRETFAMRFFPSCSAAVRLEETKEPNTNTATGTDRGTNGALVPAGTVNIFTGIPEGTGSIILTDVGSGASIETSAAGGSVGNIVNASNTSKSMGLMFYDYGVAVLDLKKICNPWQHMSGAIHAVGGGGGASFGGTTVMSGSFIPQFICSASIDQVLEHVASTRFGSGSETFMTFQNNTMINSTLYFCRATADEFNFSSNPTYADDTTGRLVVIDTGQESLQKSFCFVTTVGLYNANEELLAMAKLSRPVMKNDEKDLTFRVRLDF